MLAEPSSVAFVMADYGHDPTETAVPFQLFKRAGFSISIITEAGRKPDCDHKMLTGWTGLLFGAKRSAVDAYHEMIESTEWQSPIAWSDSSVSLTKFDLLFLPGGHDKGIRQVLDSSRVQQLIAEYWPLTMKPSGKYCAAICHGVQLLAHTKIDGISVLNDVTTTALTGTMENSVYWATRLFLGDYYKTYGSCTPNVEEVVKNSLRDPSVQWKGTANTLAPFITEDEKYNYLSGRYPGDAVELASRIIDRVKSQE